MFLIIVAIAFFFPFFFSLYFFLLKYHLIIIPSNNGNKNAHLNMKKAIKKVSFYYFHIIITISINVCCNKSSAFIRIFFLILSTCRGLWYGKAW